MLDDIKIIISLYRKFNRYKRYSDKELFFNILPSYQLKQYTLHKQGNEVIAFTNWAFLNEDAEKRFISSGKLTTSDWKSGNNVWHINIVCVKNVIKVMSEAKNNFKNMLGINKPVKWLRIDDNKNIYRKGIILTKENW
jgi:hemolysin-activating ACP:hemolysin acyltransferase